MSSIQHTVLTESTMSPTQPIFPGGVQIPPLRRNLLLIAIGASATNPCAKEAEVKSVYVAPEGNEVRIDVELSPPVNPTISVLRNPHRLIIEFPAPLRRSTHLSIHRNGVRDFLAESDPANPAKTRIVVEIDSPRPYGSQPVGSKFALSILPHPGREALEAAMAPSSTTNATPPRPSADRSSPADATKAQDQTRPASPCRHQFKLRRISDNTVCVDGGSNSGLQHGMILMILATHSISARTQPASNPDLLASSLAS